VPGTGFLFETGAVFDRAGQLHHDQRPGPGAADRVLWVIAEALFTWRDPDQLGLGGPQIVRQMPGELCWSLASGPTFCPPVSAELGVGHTESATLSWTSGGRPTPLGEAPASGLAAVTLNRTRQGLDGL